MEGAKEAFLRKYGEDYGYPHAPKNVDQIRASEFKRLDGLVYLDHAGATLYSESQIEAVFKDLSSNVYGNPHSQSDSSMATSEVIRAAREQVLALCNASSEDYKCIFTSGATAALKLIGEAFPWSRESCYMYTMDNHNSVLGIREYALEKEARAVAIDINNFEKNNDPSGVNGLPFEAVLHSEQRRTNAKFSKEPLHGEIYNLFAFPSECNFSGIKYPLGLVNLVKEDAGRILKGSPCYRHARGKWMVLVDAAKGCATESPDLARFAADFVTLSFYKIFGYPTGLGALIIKNEAANMLKKVYFSGGTVSASIADMDFVKPRESLEQLFEDGTVSFLSIASLQHGFRIINMLTASAIARHTRSLASYVRSTLLDLRHANGAFICQLYGCISETMSLQMGPTIAFNLRRPDGSWFGYHEVEKLASLAGIQLRTGCFCNPGACARYLGLSHCELMSNIEAGHVCWDDHDILNGKPTGAVRISFGYMSTFEDAEIFLGFIRKSFTLSPTSVMGTVETISLAGCEPTQLLRSPFLKSIFVYPIKSCVGFSVDRWPLCDRGLLYDREWLLRSSDGEVLTQKKVPALCKISASVDLEKHQLLLEASDCTNKLQIPLQQSSCNGIKDELDLHGERYEVQGYSVEVNMWFTEVIGRSCSLLRFYNSNYQRCTEKGDKRRICRDMQSKLSFVNEAQILLVSDESVSDLNRQLKSDTQEEIVETEKPFCVDPLRFRPNLICSGSQPYEEDRWTTLFIGKSQFTSVGGCNRCQMINIDPNNYQSRSKEPLATLSKFRRVQGKILFGILLRYEVGINVKKQEGSPAWLEVGQKIFPDYKL